MPLGVIMGASVPRGSPRLDSTTWGVVLLQVHKFVVGVAPVRSLCRVGWAAKQLLSIPADQLRSTSSGSRHNISSEVAFTRQLRRGVTTLARAVTLEALGLGASVAGGADFVFRGGSGSGSDHPAGRVSARAFSVLPPASISTLYGSLPSW